MRRLAAIDIGTNTVLLLIAEVGVGGKILPLRQEQITTRLGKGLQEKSVLSTSAIDATVAAIEKYEELCRTLGAERIILAGTSALREAANTDTLFKNVERRLGLKATVLSEEEEAQWSYHGALSNKKNLKGPILFVDIGGGSTEFTWGDTNSVAGMRSLKIGCVRLTERFITTDPVSADEFLRLQSFVREEVAALGADFPSKPSHLIGAGGTVTTLAAMAQGMEVYDSDRVDGYVLAVETLQIILQELRDKPLPARRKIPGLDPERADIILAGTVILKVVMGVFGFNGVMVSDRGLRHGLIVREIVNS